MKIYKLHFDAYDMFVTVDSENKVIYYSTDEFVYDVDIRDVEDDSSWESDCRGMDFDEFASGAEIVDSCDFN